MDFELFYSSHLGGYTRNSKRASALLKDAIPNPTWHRPKVWASDLDGTRFSLSKTGVFYGIFTTCTFTKGGNHCQSWFIITQRVKIHNWI